MNKRRFAVMSSLQDQLKEVLLEALAAVTNPGGTIFLYIFLVKMIIAKQMLQFIVN